MSALTALTGLHLAHGPLRFVESNPYWSVYTDRYGDEVYLAHGTAQVLLPFDELDLNSLWQDWKRERGWYSPDFTVYVETLTYEPAQMDEWFLCSDCSDWEHVDERTTTATGSEVCESCIDGYWFCGDCEEYHTSTTTTLDDTEVCERCRRRNWTFCGHCDGYRRDDDDYEHDHSDNCDDCESPAQAFTIPNNGDGRLGNDDIVTVTLPAGVISAEGIGAMATYLRNAAWTYDGDEQRIRMLSYRLTEVGDKWQTKDGNFTKRLGKFAYKEFEKLKLAPEVISQIGCIARDHSTAVDFRLSVTRDLNQSADDFGHESSCWWQSYSASRCALKTNGGFGLRTWQQQQYNGWEAVQGRAWVMPLRLDDDDLVPTFETQSPSAYVVFNGYGDLEGYAPARLLSHMTGWTYRKITFKCRVPQHDGSMYVNGDSGYLIAPEEIASQYTDGSLHLRVDQHSDLYETESYNRETVHTYA